MKHKSLLRRLLAAATTLALTATLALPVFAAPGQNAGDAGPDTSDKNTAATSTITVTGNEGDLEGVTITAYQLLDLINNPETGTDENDGNTTRVYMPGKGFDVFFSSDAAATDDNKLVKQYEKITEGTDGKKQGWITYSNFRLVINASEPADGTEFIGPVDLTDLDTTFYAADLVSRMIGQEDKDGNALTGTAADIAKFSDWVSEYIKTNSSKEYTSKSSAPVGTATDTILTVENMPEGYYVVMATKTSDGDEIIITNSILNVEGAANITLKTDGPTLTKTVAENDKHAAIDENMTFTLETTLPDFTYYTVEGQNYVYEIVDTMKNQRLSPSTAFTIQVGTDSYTGTVPTSIGASTPIKDTSGKTIANLTVDAYDTDAKSQKFTLTFVFANLQPYADGTEVTITYESYLTEDAVSADDNGANENTAVLTFSNDPYSDTTSTTTGKDTLTDTETVYTYGAVLSKDFSDGKTTEYYSNVKFKLYEYTKNEDFNKEWSVADGTQVAVTGNNGSYILQNGNNKISASTEDLVLDSTGKLTLFGLDSDKIYFLVETGAPTGFNPVIVRLELQESDDVLTNDGAVVNVAEYGNGTYNEEKATKLDKAVITADTTTDTAKSYMKFTVMNQKGFVLPTTGGEGIWVLTIGGVLLAAAGCWVLFPRKKRQ